MDLKLHSNDKIRLITGSSKNNFIDCSAEYQEMALTVSFLCSQTYMEIRRKNNQVKTFYFESKRHKKEFENTLSKETKKLLSETANMKILHIVAFILLAIGGLNWGLEVLGYGLGNYLPGNLMTLVYVLVGLSGIWMLVKQRPM